MDVALAIDDSQERADPDAEHLVRCRDSVREYEPRPGRRYVKQLVDGRWESTPAGQS